MTNRFRPCEHLRRPEDFRRVYEARCTAVDGPLIIHVAANELQCNRVGFSVSKKLVGNAVTRNRTKRVLREAYRLTKATMPAGYDIVFVPRSAKLPPFEQLLEIVPRLIGNIIARIAKKKLET